MILVEDEKDPIILEELKEAGILCSIYFGKYKGILGNIKFSRWYSYWEVNDCHVPLHVVHELYNTKIGKKYIRIDGYSKRVSPEEWLEPEEKYVNRYHIDSQEGLNLFVATMKEYKLF
jgi:hypothetical protein